MVSTKLFNGKLKLLEPVFFVVSVRVRPDPEEALIRVIVRVSAAPLPITLKLTPRILLLSWKQSGLSRQEAPKISRNMNQDGLLTVLNCGCKDNLTLQRPNSVPVYF